MSQEKQEGGCCGTHGSAGPCCAGKKIMVFVIVGALIFLAGMLFAKFCPLGGGANQMCPIPGR